MSQNASFIAVKHNIEVAHRLSELPGKCEQIHGHSMWVTLYLRGEVNKHGILGGIEFGDLKKKFRSHLDEEYDHRLLLNVGDPFAAPIYLGHKNDAVDRADFGAYELDTEKQYFLPGLNVMPGDPTTENIAQWIANHMRDEVRGFGIQELRVEVWETSVNMASAHVWGTDAPTV